ncbi:hypothetical protein [uncultured Fluviicola sp.]|uniref:hypothetical protein n=1 Tax=uncultured Fluviicola sp. TaxID=463303 RepID=UPI0025CE922B|nr:hypothetical protein [uncultured Fluviicola sp.]
MIIHLELSPHDLNDISYFSLGNFTFEKDGVCFTSKNRKPDQSCMLLCSLPDLFDRLMRLKRGEIRKCVFSPDDCSYTLLFEKQKDKLLISEFSREKLICGIDEFAQALHLEVEELFIRYDFEIEYMDIARQDFIPCWNEFKSLFPI